MAGWTYRLKRALCYPYIRAQRAKHVDLDHFGRSMLEEHGYSRHILRFAGDYEANDPLHTFPLDEQSVVVDLGGYTGTWAWEIHRRYHPFIHIYEPWPGGVAKIQKRFQDVEKVEVHACAVSDRNERAELTVLGPGSTFTRGVGEGSRSSSTIEVELRDIATVIDGLPERIDLLKLNIEGSEFPVLERMIEKDLLRRCGAILVQFHEREPYAYWRRWRIVRSLERTHRRIWNYPFVWECWQRD